MKKTSKVKCDLCGKEHEVYEGNFYPCPKNSLASTNYIVMVGGQVNQTNDFRNVRVLLGLDRKGH